MKKWFYILTFLIVVLVGIAVVGAIEREKKDDITIYVQNLNLDTTNMVLEGKEEISFFNYTSNVLNEIHLHLYPNAFRKGAKAKVVSLSNYDKAYPNGVSYGKIDIESVSTKNNRANNIDANYLDYIVAGEDENILIIKIPELYPDERFNFEIGFSVNIPRINHRFGYGENTINLGNYYPIICVYENNSFIEDLYDSNGDPFYSKIANYEINITYDKELTMASSGCCNTSLDGDKKISTVLAKNVRDFAMVFSSKCSLLQQQFDGVNIGYFYYGDTRPNDTMQTICKVLETNKKYGKYPYQNLNVVEANFVHGGMEYPNLVLISDELVDYETYINVVIHEVCHQWWYGVVGNDEYSYGFLDEGLTDYTTARFYDYYPEYGISSKEIFFNALKSYANFVKIYGDVRDDFSTNMQRKLCDFETENEYVYISYVKGMLLFASLQDMLGIKKIDKCLKYYYDCNKYKEATPNDLIMAFNLASGRDFTSYFYSWFNGQEKAIITKL